MPYHHTKSKGDLAVAKIILDLKEKGYDIYLPHITEHSRFDLIAGKDNKLYKIQCKYSSNGHICPATSWADKNGNHVKSYVNGDFDYYAIYLASINKIIYPSIKFSGHNVRTTLPNSANKFYWWEDFVNLTNEANKKTYKDFNTKIIRKSVPKIRKVERPSRKDLHILIWSKPTTEIAKDYNLSDKTIQKWVDDYKLIKPARGYWAKVKFGKIIHSVPEYKE